MLSMVKYEHHRIIMAINKYIFNKTYVIVNKYVST